jgi:hypothetical protein
MAGKAIGGEVADDVGVEPYVVPAHLVGLLADGGDDGVEPVFDAAVPEVEWPGVANEIFEEASALPVRTVAFHLDGVVA